MVVNQPASIAPLPTRLNAEQAWSVYCALAAEYEADADKRVDLEFCKRLAHAHDRWRALYLASERAA